MTSKQVAEHYNEIKNTSVVDRQQSHIIPLRRFNNAMKALLIDKAMSRLRLLPGHTGVTQPYRILEFGCGKGGDLKKYYSYNAQTDIRRNILPIGYVLGYDIAATSIQHCQQRYKEMNVPRKFKAKFCVADLTRDEISEEEQFHLVSAQFCIHYSFESYSQANRFIGNAAKNLAPLCYFIGTYPDGARLVKLAREASKNGDGEYGEYNVGDILQVKFEREVLDKPRPFGSKYHFKLKDVVDCPEYLVHPEILKHLLEANGFMLDCDRSFHDFFHDFIDGMAATADTERTLVNIFKNFNGLSYVPEDKYQTEEYEHLHKLVSGPKGKTVKRPLASMPKSMWQATSIYRVFIARKR